MGKKLILASSECQKDFSADAIDLSLEKQNFFRFLISGFKNVIVITVKLFLFDILS